MNRKNINFDNKNIKKSDFYHNNKKKFNIDDRLNTLTFKSFKHQEHIFLHKDY